MDLKNSFLIKFFSGGIAGMLISAIIMFSFDGAEFVDSHGLEVLRQITGSFIYGAIAMGGSITYEIESWGIVKATATHYIVTMSSFLITNYLLGWFGTGKFLLFAFAGFTVAYIIIWISQALAYSKQVREVNEMLELLPQNHDDDDAS